MANGKTYTEAVVNGYVFIEEWIETTKSLNRPIPESMGRLLYA
jgi:predicted RNase H-like HicB family nuclease